MSEQVEDAATDSSHGDGHSGPFPGRERRFFHLDQGGWEARVGQIVANDFHETDSARSTSPALGYRLLDYYVERSIVLRSTSQEVMGAASSRGSELD